MSNFLGFSLGFNASAAVIDEHGVLAAVSQERLNGQKNTKELPIDAMIECCKIANVKDLIGIAYGHYQVLTWEEIEKYCPAKYYGYMNEVADREDLNAEEKLFLMLLNIFGKYDIHICSARLVRVEHHEAHKFAAFPIYGREDNRVVITSDGFGDGYSSSIELNGVTLSKLNLVNSVALIYQFVTGALGFKMHQHEGKITGLAAYGEPIYLEEFRCLLYTYNWHIDVDRLDELEEDELKQVESSTIIDFDLFLRLKKTVFRLVNELVYAGAKREDIAATVQELAEKLIIRQIEVNLSSARKEAEKCVCYLSGGLFANVKINQRIKELDMFKEVVVVPPMGDEGTAIGSAAHMMANTHGIDIDWLNGRIEKNYDNVICGSSIECLSKSDIDKLTKEGYCVQEYLNEDEMIDKITDLLADKKIVCFCRGKMEFGPRALCHRSILYDCTERETNDWLNKQLGRTEFMPFAPVCIDKFANDLFHNIDVDVDRTAKFMTMTFDGKKEFRENYKAACHIDGTARPQIVTKNDGDIFVYKLLEMYYNKTNKKALINTSFNLHNYPIIKGKKVAIESWKKSNTDALVINNVIIVKK